MLDAKKLPSDPQHITTENYDTSARLRRHVLVHVCNALLFWVYNSRVCVWSFQDLTFFFKASLRSIWQVHGRLSKFWVDSPFRPFLSSTG